MSHAHLPPTYALVRPEPTADPGTLAFPRVQGMCPTCGSSSLFLGAGGYVTCSWIQCSDPCSASVALGVDFAPEKAQS